MPCPYMYARTQIKTNNSLQIQRIPQQYGLSSQDMCICLLARHYLANEFLDVWNLVSWYMTTCMTDYRQISNIRPAPHPKTQMFLVSYFSCLCANYLSRWWTILLHTKILEIWWYVFHVKKLYPVYRCIFLLDGMWACRERKRGTSFIKHELARCCCQTLSNWEEKNV